LADPAERDEAADAAAENAVLREGRRPLLKDKELAGREVVDDKFELAELEAEVALDTAADPEEPVAGTVKL